MALLDKLRTDHMNQAATTVQRHVRGFLARRHYRAMHAAALALQRATRAYFARKVAQGLREQKSALLIQVRRRTLARYRRPAAATPTSPLSRFWQEQLCNRNRRRP